MFKMNRKTEYALMALAYMKARPDKTKTSAREICDELSIPFDTTSKVMQTMNQAGLLKSAQGVKGGYSLSSDLGDISYLELTHLIEGKPLTMDCLSGPCELYGNCNISGPVKKLNNYLSHFFESLTLKELLEDDNLLHLTTTREQETQALHE